MFDAYHKPGDGPASGHRIHRRRVVIIPRQVPKPPSVTLLILGLHISGLQAVNRLHHCHSIAVVAPDPLLIILVLARRAGLDSTMSSQGQVRSRLRCDARLACAFEHLCLASDGLTVR